jgi:hypothetical protein
MIEYRIVYEIVKTTVVEPDPHHFGGAGAATLDAVQIPAPTALTPNLMIDIVGLSKMSPTATISYFPCLLIHITIYS